MDDGITAQEAAEQVAWAASSPRGGMTDERGLMEFSHRLLTCRARTGMLCNRCDAWPVVRASSGH